jgi:hypothetical protein
MGKGRKKEKIMFQRNEREEGWYEVIQDNRAAVAFVMPSKVPTSSSTSRFGVV